MGGRGAGSTYTRLKGFQRDIERIIGVSKENEDWLNKYPGTSITNEFSANGVKYRTEITKQNNKYLYTLKEGRKFIVKEGSKVNMQNQIAKILDKALKKKRK